MRKQYVLGFVFTDDKKNVLLIKKNKEDWQKDQINGIGGKIESNENPIDAMDREFNEEAGFGAVGWKYFSKVIYPLCDLYLFTTITGSDKSYTIISDEGEIKFYSIEDLKNLPAIHNIQWMIHLALDPYTPFTTIFTDHTSGQDLAYYKKENEKEA